MKKIIFLFLLSFNFLIANVYSDYINSNWTVQDLGTMTVLVKYSTDKLGMLTIGVSNLLGDNVQMIHSNLHSGQIVIKIEYDNENKLYDISNYNSGGMIIINEEGASVLIEQLYNTKEVFIYCDRSLVCKFELKDLTSLLNKYR